MSHERYELTDGMDKQSEDFKVLNQYYLLCMKKANRVCEQSKNMRKNHGRLLKELEIQKELMTKSETALKKQTTLIENFQKLIDQNKDIQKQLDKKVLEVFHLHETIGNLQADYNLMLEHQVHDHENEKEKLIKKYDDKVAKLEKEISFLVASSEIETQQYEHDKEEIISKYEKEITDLKQKNNKVQSTLVIYEKQIAKLNAEKRISHHERNFIPETTSSGNEKRTSHHEQNFMREPTTSSGNTFSQTETENIPTVQEIIELHHSKFKHFKDLYSKDPFSEPFEAMQTQTKASPSSSNIKRSLDFSSRYSASAKGSKDAHNFGVKTSTFTNDTFRNSQKKATIKPFNKPFNMSPLPIRNERNDEKPKCTATKKRKLYNPKNDEDDLETFVNNLNNY